MAARRHQSFWLTCALILAAPRLVLAQSQLSPPQLATPLSQAPSGTTLGANLPGVMGASANGGNGSADLTGSAASNTTGSDAPASIDSLVLQSSDQMLSPDAGRQPSTAFTAGALLFGIPASSGAPQSSSAFASLSAARPGAAVAGSRDPGASSAAGFGLPASYRNAGFGPSAATSISAPHAPQPGAASAQRLAVGNAGGVSGRPAADRQAGSSSGNRASSQPARGALTADADGAGGAASQARDFPDSTMGTAMLSPGDGSESPFPGPPEGLSFLASDFGARPFLRPTLGVGRGAGKAGGRTADGRYLNRQQGTPSSSESRLSTRGRTAGSPSLPAPGMYGLSGQRKLTNGLGDGGLRTGGLGTTMRPSTNPAPVPF
jgi:hypothetical protein